MAGAAVRPTGIRVHKCKERGREGWAAVPDPHAEPASNPELSGIRSKSALTIIEQQDISGIPFPFPFPFPYGVAGTGTGRTEGGVVRESRWVI